MTPKISVPRGACQLAGRVPHEKGTTQTMQHRRLYQSVGRGGTPLCHDHEEEA